MAKIVDVIRNKRIALGLTQAEFAELIGTTGATISGFENGKEVSSPVFNMMHVVLKRKEAELSPVERDIFNIRWRAMMLECENSKDGLIEQIGRITKTCGFLIENLYKSN